MRIILFLLALTLPVAATAQHTLWAGLIKSKGYVVGSPLSQSGLHYLTGDTTWAHVGWNHPRSAGLSTPPGQPDTLYVAAGNGVLRSFDGGTSWRIVTGWEVTEATGIDVDPNRPADVYVATAYGVWRSMDHGQTWTEANAGFEKRYTQKIEVDDTQPGRVLAATEGGVYVSANAGVAWTYAGVPHPVISLSQSEADPMLWMAGTQRNGLFLSRDGGQTWSRAEGVSDAHSIYTVSPDPTDANRMAAGGWDTGLLISTDGGETWTTRTDGLPIPHLYCLAFDPDNPGRLYAATVEAGIFVIDSPTAPFRDAGLYGTLVWDMTFLDG
ncbi:MAG: hypothetical protein AAGI08_09670 [Bacteroidota bacterium]